MNIALRILIALIAIVVGGFIGGILSGLDRVFGARMQRRQGPPVMQPFYDASRFFKTRAYIVNGLQDMLVVGHLIFLLLSLGIIYSGQDILLAVFSLTLSEMLMCLAAFSASAPYSNMSAQREMLQMACTEPLFLLICIGFYLCTGSFMVQDIIAADMPAIVRTPGIFLAFMVILPVELRKSPFDVSTSHHAHQEMVKGITTDISGKTMGFVEIAEWFELFLMVTLIGLFFLTSNPLSIIWAVIAVLVVMFVMTLVDNIFPRVKWERMLKFTWGTTFIAGGANLLILMMLTYPFVGS